VEDAAGSHWPQGWWPTHRPPLLAVGELVLAELDRSSSPRGSSSRRCSLVARASGAGVARAAPRRHMGRAEVGGTRSPLYRRLGAVRQWECGCDDKLVDGEEEREVDLDMVPRSTTLDGAQ
jgi:hypothetical protein